jgi:hypothetical protein
MTLKGNRCLKISKYFLHSFHRHHRWLCCLQLVPLFFFIFWCFGLCYDFKLVLTHLVVSALSGLLPESLTLLFAVLLNIHDLELHLLRILNFNFYIYVIDIHSSCKSVFHSARFLDSFTIIYFLNQLSVRWLQQLIASPPKYLLLMHFVGATTSLACTIYLPNNHWGDRSFCR